MRNPKFLGVYSLRTASVNGQRPKFFVWLLPDGNYAIQELDAALSQRGPARSVSPAGLQKAFKAEPSILAAPVTTPDFRPLASPPRKPQPEQEVSPDGDGAAPEPARSAGQLEAALRGNFAKALRALKRPEGKKSAMAVIERILRTQNGIEPSHKHMFRDFGVALRKQSLPELALLSAQRAVFLAPQDDHARFNLARLLGILGRYQEAEAQLSAARKLDPSEGVYDRLSSYLAKERLRAARLSLDDDD